MAKNILKKCKDVDNKKIHTIILDKDYEWLDSCDSFQDAVEYLGSTDRAYEEFHIFQPVAKVTFGEMLVERIDNGKTNRSGTCNNGYTLWALHRANTGRLVVA